MTRAKSFFLAVSPLVSSAEGRGGRRSSSSHARKNLWYPGYGSIACDKEAGAMTTTMAAERASEKKFILRENRSLRHHAIWNCCLVRFCDDHSRKIRPHLKNWAVTNKPDRVWKDANSSFWGFFCSPHGIVVVAWASFVLRHLEEGDLLRASFDNLRDVRDQRGRIGHRALIRITRITRTQRSSIVGIAKAPFWDRNIDKLLWCAGVVSWNL